MGNWSIAGILLMIVVFFLLVTFIFSQIHVTNPLNGQETNVIGWIISALAGD